MAVHPKRWVMKIAMLLIITVAAVPAVAIPTLQLYIEGATYDTTEETWVITQPSFTLWVIGNVEQFGIISDVKLAAAVKSAQSGSISLTPTTTSLLTDPSIPPDPTPTSNFPSPDGAVPKLSDGRDLLTHGIYGQGVKFFEWKLGDFTLTDSPIGGFIGDFPTEFPKKGQINAYLVTVSGFSWVHFDAYGTKGGNPGPVFAPFSHDALYTPEPHSLWLLMAGVLLLARRRKRAIGPS